MKPYYTSPDGRIVLYCGDCREVLPTLEAVDHLITDPPYSAPSHALHDSGKRWAQEQDGRDRAKLSFRGIDGPELAALLTFAPVRRWAVFTMDDRLSAWLRLHPPEGWNYIRTAVWVKPGSMPQFTGDRPAMGYEPMPILHRQGERLRWNGKGRTCVWTVPPVHGEHPTEKPIRLYRSLISLFTDPGETILDCFAGSGTTLRAAKDLGRKAVGIEINEHYAEIAARRMEQEVLPLEGIA